MAKKRKLESKSTEQPQSQLQEQLDEEEEYGDQDSMEEEEEEEEEEYEYEEEEEVEEEEEEEDDEVAVDPNNANQTKKQSFTPLSGATSSARNQNHQNHPEDDDEPIQNLLEPFSKEQLINLLREAADNHPDVADRVRKLADEDATHRKIFVHGLSWETNTETIAAAFKPYGEIEDCRAVVDKVSGKSKGYGFVLFKTRAGARNALKEPQKKIGNRMTACQLASIGPVGLPSAVVPIPLVALQQPKSEHTQKKIYVSNVSAELDPQKLLTFFSKYGEIEDGPLGLDKQTGKPRGFCLFVYKTVESAKSALEEPHKNFEGHILHCQKAIDGPKPNKIKQQNAQSSRNENTSSYIGSAPMAPAMPANLGAAAASLIPLNPALGQALTLLATQGVGLGLNNLFGAFGNAGVVNPGGHGLQGGYGNQGVGSGIISPGVMGGYGNQGGFQNQLMEQGGSSRSQHGAGHMGGGAPYMGH